MYELFSSRRLRKHRRNDERTNHPTNQQNTIFVFKVFAAIFQIKLNRIELFSSRSLEEAEVANE